MNAFKANWVQILFILSLCLTACMPAEEAKTASISGGSFFDADGNGTFSEGETGVANMCVRLYHGACGENMIENRNTNEKGEFQFNKLAAGDYCVVSDFELLTCGYGGNHPTNSISRHVTLESGMNTEIEWFGFTNLSGETDP
jgi:hypothetical protein